MSRAAVYEPVAGLPAASLPTGPEGTGRPHYPLVAVARELQEAAEAPPPTPPTPVEPEPLTDPIVGGRPMLLIVLALAILFVWPPLFLLSFTLVGLGLAVFSRNRRLKRDHGEAERAYEAARWEYESQAQRYACELERAQDPQRVAAYRAQRYREALGSTPVPVRTAWTFKEGAAEPAFFAHLTSRFGDRVMRGVTVDTGCDDEDRVPYLPDFVYWDPETGVAIDIEVDEPYVLGSGAPIHCVGEDAPRDAFFSDWGWTVLRFAEWQVVCEPEACCDEVAALARSLARGEVAARTPTRVTPVPVWTNQEAARAAEAGVRDGYLREQRLPSPPAPLDDPAMSKLIPVEEIEARYALIREAERRYAGLEVITDPLPFEDPDRRGRKGYRQSWMFRVAAMTVEGEEKAWEVCEAYGGGVIDLASLIVLSLKVVVHEYGTPAQTPLGFPISSPCLPKRGDRITAVVDEVEPGEGGVTLEVVSYLVEGDEACAGQSCDPWTG